MFSEYTAVKWARYDEMANTMIWSKSHYFKRNDRYSRLDGDTAICGAKVPQLTDDTEGTGYPTCLRCQNSPKVS